ncbi:hypothetical protein R6Q59_030209 [Mikania micrantha]
MSFNHSNTPEFRTNDTSALEFQMAEVDWMSQDLVDDTFWNMDELWQFKNLMCNKKVLKPSID